jgi:NAD(P)-dependent dehydrogenase (short-subunit alcohol dehydrogenase family)
MTVEISLEGRHALVTGGGTGIGFGIASRLLAAGAAVTICGRRQDVVDRAAETMRASVPGGQVRSIRADVTVEADVAAAVAAASGSDGRLDIAVANAGSASPGPLLAQTPESFRSTLELNIVAQAMTIKHAGIAMKDAGNGGAIVAISSVSALRPALYMAPYTVSKAGLEALVRCAALELAPFRIRVNAVRPGLVMNEVLELLDMDAAPDPFPSVIERTPLGAPGTAEQLGDSVLYLTSDLSRWVTGQIYSVCGGLSVSDHDDFGEGARMIIGAEVYDRATQPTAGA